jgi:hypothetical protein
MGRSLLRSGSSALPADDRRHAGGTERVDSYITSNAEQKKVKLIT